MISGEIIKLYHYLCSFLGDSKYPLDESLQCQFPCPRCLELKGENERVKFNLEVNIRKGIFQCWSCNSGESEMHGSIYKLIKMYGSDGLVKAYKDVVKDIRESEMYRLCFDETDFLLFNEGKEEMELPNGFVLLNRKLHENHVAYQYLKGRGVDWDIIEENHIGFTIPSHEDWRTANRIIIPSYDKFSELNYWTGRDFTSNPKRQKYYNPQVERMKLLFNEDRVQWDADVTLVEGPFDHIVVPNSIPLLGKALSQEYKIYQEVMSKANANINIFLDGDALHNAEGLYRILDRDRLKGKVRIIKVAKEYDPSEVFRLYGRKGIAKCLGRASKL